MPLVKDQLDNVVRNRVGNFDMLLEMDQKDNVVLDYFRCVSTSCPVPIIIWLEPIRFLVDLSLIYAEDYFHIQTVTIFPI